MKYFNNTNNLAITLLHVRNISFLNVNAIFVSFLHDLMAETKYSKIIYLREKGADLLGSTIQTPLKITDKLVEFYKNKGRI